MVDGNDPQDNWHDHFETVLAICLPHLLSSSLYNLKVHPLPVDVWAHVKMASVRLAPDLTSILAWFKHSTIYVHILQIKATYIENCMTVGFRYSIILYHAAGHVNSE